MFCVGRSSAPNADSRGMIVRLSRMRHGILATDDRITMTSPGLVANETLKTIVIVGGGLSGALVAIQLLQRASSPLRVVVIEPRAEVGRGVAYSTVSPAHLLNVRAGNMSMFPAQPEDFLNYLRTIGSLNLSAKDFAQRQRFGAYVSERLVSAQRRRRSGSAVRTPKRSCAANRSRW